MAETVRQVHTPQAQLIVMGVAAMLGGTAMFRWWRGLARWNRRWSFWPKRAIESFYGTDDAPKRGFVFASAAFVILWGIGVLVAGILDL